MIDNPSSHLHTHPSLLLRLRDARDNGAWALFVEVYTPLIFRYCRKHHLQEADAAEVAQEVLLQVNRSITAFEYQPERGRFRDWLGSVVRSKLSRFFRKARPGTNDDTQELANLPALQSDADWADHFNDDLLQTTLTRIQGEFEEHTWLAFTKVWRENNSAAETAKDLAMPVSMVYVAKSRVLKRLREEILLLAEDIPHLAPMPRTRQDDSDEKAVLSTP
ncbi:MAG: sigma-70 family RNA polymerase sigma factor [Gemmatales bacterium]